MMIRRLILTRDKGATSINISHQKDHLITKKQKKKINLSLGLLFDEPFLVHFALRMIGSNLSFPNQRFEYGN